MMALLIDYLTYLLIGLCLDRMTAKGIINWINLSISKQIIIITITLLIVCARETYPRFLPLCSHSDA